MADTTLDPAATFPVNPVAGKSDPIHGGYAQPAPWQGNVPSVQPPYAQPQNAPAPAYGPVGYAPAHPHGYQPAPMNQHFNATVNVNVGAPTILIAPASDGPSLIVRAMWFVCIGWWLSALTIFAGYLLVYTVIGIPLAFMLFNKLPQATTLKARTRNWAVETRNGVSVLTTRHTDQRSWAVRGLYFVCVGFWLGALWLSLAWVVGLFLITLPITLWMYDRAPAVLTLHRH